MHVLTLGTCLQVPVLCSGSLFYRIDDSYRVSKITTSSNWNLTSFLPRRASPFPTLQEMFRT